jgi:hypothetical protein
MPANREQLTEELSERIRRFGEQRDPMAVLDAVVPGLARDLAGTFKLGVREAVTADVASAMTVLVAVHWIRSQLLPPGQDQDDLEACLSWSAVLLPIRPELVPEPIRAHLGQP